MLPQTTPSLENVLLFAHREAPLQYPKSRNHAEIARSSVQPEIPPSVVPCPPFHLQQRYNELFPRIGLSCNQAALMVLLNPDGTIGPSNLETIHLHGLLRLG